MRKLIIQTAAALLLLAGQATAKSVSSEISIGEYKSRCLAAGGTVTNVSAGGVKCRLPSGAVVTCYDTDGPGISCDYRSTPGGKKPLILHGGPDSMQ